MRTNKNTGWVENVWFAAHCAKCYLFCATFHEWCFFQKNCLFFVLQWPKKTIRESFFSQNQKFRKTNWNNFSLKIRAELKIANILWFNLFKILDFDRNNYIHIQESCTKKDSPCIFFKRLKKLTRFEHAHPYHNINFLGYVKEQYMHHISIHTKCTEPESSHPYFLQTYDVSDCGPPKYSETRPLSARTNRNHSKIRLCVHHWQCRYVLNTPVNLGRFGLCCLRKAIKLVNYVAQAKLPETVHRYNNLTRSWRWFIWCTVTF